MRPGVFPCILLRLIMKKTWQKIEGSELVPSAVPFARPLGSGSTLLSPTEAHNSKIPNPRPRVQHYSTQGLAIAVNSREIL